MALEENGPTPVSFAQRGHMIQDLPVSSGQNSSYGPTSNVTQLTQCEMSVLTLSRTMEASEGHTVFLKVSFCAIAS